MGRATKGAKKGRPDRGRVRERLRELAQERDKHAVPSDGRAGAISITGAKNATKKCCRSAPRCKGCPVVLMRTARLQEAGLTGKDLKKAVKKARAA